MVAAAPSEAEAMTTHLGTAARPSRHDSDPPPTRRPARLVPVGEPLAGPRPSASGPRPRVDGKFLAVGEERLWLAGVTYGTFAPGEDGAPYGDARQLEADFRAMAANGVNALRTYTVPPRRLLDAALRHGLWVTVGLPWEQHVAFLDSRRRASAIEARVREGVRACAGHPAVLGYLVGNEIPASIVRWHGRRRVERFVERLRRAVKREDPHALVSYASFPSTEYLDLAQLDFVAFNVYLEDPARLAAYVARLQNLAGERPLVMTELGLDSRHHGREAQASGLREQLRTSFAGGCAGTFLFAWTDAWHTGGAEVREWDFGLVDRARRPKPALAAARSAYANLPLGRAAAVAPPPPRVSVVVCTLNGAATIGETLAGIARLAHPDVEAIVVDDGSTDATAEIVAAHPGVRLIRTPNRGLSAARNTGMRAATGELVAYLDDDAYPDSQWLDYVALALRDGAHAGVGGPNLPVPGDGLVAESVANAPGGPVHVLLSDTVAEHVPGCNMAFRRDRLMAIGGFDEQFRVAGDDVDVCWRLQREGWTLGFHPAALVWHHRRGSVRGFWRQQRGYGRAEALLERAWPQKYNTPGHLAWGGRIYGRGSVPLRRSRVYYGQFGAGAFQPGIEQPQPLLLALAGAPEWWLAIALLAAASALGSVARPLLAAVPLLALALALPLWQALATARRCDVRDRALRVRLAGGALTTLLVLAQPLARLAGRTEGGLTPWRRGCPTGRRRAGVRLPRARVVSSWHERRRPLAERVTALEAALRAGGLRVRRADACERWELHTAAGAFGGVRLRAAVEEHGRGRQLVRVRVRPHLPRVGRWTLAALAACALAAAAFAEWTTAAVAGVPLALLAACAAFECGAATAVALRAVHALEERA
jgi:GT2 family glycosyltransferase